MVTVSIADGIHFLDADMGRDVLDDFNQEASRSQAFEILGQVPVDAQGFFTLDTFVYPLHRADEQTKLTFHTTQGESDRGDAQILLKQVQHQFPFAHEPDRAIQNQGTMGRERRQIAQYQPVVPSIEQ